MVIILQWSVFFPVESLENPELPEESLPVDRPETALKVLREWNPPLLGELPPTFLKVAGMPIAKSNKVRGVIIYLHVLVLGSYVIKSARLYA